MAQPIPLDIPPRNAQDELRARLARAREEHAEAFLAAFELLHAMHDQGLLEIARGVLGARDEVLRRLATNASAPEAVRTIRNVLFCSRILGSIEPEGLQAILGGIPAGIAQATAERKQPVNFFSLLHRLTARDSLRALAAGIDFLQSFGRLLLAKDTLSSADPS